MNAGIRSPIRIAVVSTRDISRRAGRPGILSRIIQSLKRNNEVEVFRLQNVMEMGGIRDFGGAFLSWFWSLLRGHPLPLQCLLYASPRACARLTEQICGGGFEAVYLDTVRCQMLLRSLRRTIPNIQIVTDFDDLMSRRMAYLSKNHLPLLPGHVAPSLPSWLRHAVAAPLARFITRYEAATLPHCEDEVIAQSDAIVLLSVVERQMLRSRLNAKHQALLHAIPPAVEVQADPWQPPQQLRFVFIGSDDLLQNRSAIDYLLDKWRVLKPATPLHIYGHQTRSVGEVAGVHWHGFVENLSEVYQPGSIALVPALISGGIKTKVIEAWAWGCPVLSNAAALEGFAIADYHMMLSETQWDRLLLDPAAHPELWSLAAQIGQEFVRRHLSAEIFEQNWENTMRLVPANAPSAAVLHAEAIQTFCAE